MRWKTWASVWRWVLYCFKHHLVDKQLASGKRALASLHNCLIVVFFWTGWRTVSALQDLFHSLLSAKSAATRAAFSVPAMRSWVDVPAVFWTFHSLLSFPEHFTPHAKIVGLWWNTPCHQVIHFRGRCLMCFCILFLSFLRSLRKISRLTLERIKHQWHVRHRHFFF